MGVILSKLIFFIASTLLISSCAKNELANNSAIEPTGSREFKIHDAQSAFKVTLVGVYMGTPDYDAIWSVINTANSQGLIDNLIQFATPIEGGIAHCIEVLNSSVRNQILDNLQNAPTSLEDSYYSIESVDDCAQ